MRFFAGVFIVAVFFGAEAAVAAETPSAYAAFTAGATEQSGLFPIWHKGNHVYIELRTDQLDQDFVETIVPGNGLGGNFLVWGNTDHLPAMLVHFERRGDKIAIVWPNTNFFGADPASALAVQYNFPQSVVGLADFAASDSQHVVLDAAPLLADVLDMNNLLNGSLGLDGRTNYRLDPSRTYFGTTKAFPYNDVIEADQTWVTDAAHVADTAPDARSLQLRVVYNFAQPRGDDDYRPRYADDRVGIYDAIYLKYGENITPSRALRYIVRWNIQPLDPGKTRSPARHPMVFILDKSIPPRYRKPISDGVLAWNAAFERIGIRDALVVREAESDPNYDPDDIRYNPIRWVTEAMPSFGADSQTLYDPRTGQEFRTGILVSASSPTGAANYWRYAVDPIRFGRASDPVPDSFIDESLKAEIMHETGHNLGLQHNFIGSMAYSARDLQDKNFTSHNGTTSTVMEYAALNLWPRGTSQGYYFPRGLGPYDYYAIEYAYGLIPEVPTIAAELPWLQRLASKWSDPRYRYASDEDVSWNDGHAADPRIEQGDLTDDPLAWCGVQAAMFHRELGSLNRFFPQSGSAYEDERNAFTWIYRRMTGCAGEAAHFIGGQYLSRAHRGDPRAAAPIIPVPLATQRRAFDWLNRFVFSDSAFAVPPGVLNKLGYSEWAGYGYVSWNNYGNLPAWAYDPPAQHDVPIVDIVGRTQTGVINYLFLPAVLRRIDQNPLEAMKTTLSMPDLFNWMNASIFGELVSSSKNISLFRRNLQLAYTTKLVALATHAPAGTPGDAQALARTSLRKIHGQLQGALARGNFNEITRAHLAHLLEKTR